MNADCKVVYNNMKTPPEAEGERREEGQGGSTRWHSRWRAAAYLSSYRSMVIHEVTADGRTLAAATVHPSEPSVRPRPLCIPPPERTV